MSKKAFKVQRLVSKKIAVSKNTAKVVDVLVDNLDRNI
jgi:hypothetical protein